MVCSPSMAQSLKKYREIVFQLLYSCNFENSEKEGAMALVMRQNAIPKSTTRKAMEQVEAVCAKQEELDAHVARLANDYEFERIPHVERSILRLAMHELLYTDLPPKVAISEAVRLTKKYATAEGASFINALLDRLYKENEGAGTVPEEQAAE